MVLAVRLHNYLATTKIDPSSCRGFENEAFQALTGLVHYAQGTAAQRSAWFRAVWNAHMNTAGTVKAGSANKSFFYSAVLNRKNSAFGSSAQPPSSGTLDAGLYPWALDDTRFAKLSDDVKHNKGPAGDKQITWKEITDGAAKWQEQHGLSTLVAAFGWVIITGLVKKYAPEAIAGLLGPEIAAGAAAGGFAVAMFDNWTVRVNNAQAKINFATDEARRQFDKVQPVMPSELDAIT